MKKLLILLFSLNFLICSKSVFADEILRGFDAYKNKDYQLAFDIWSKLASEGDPIAQNSLGVMFQKGEGTEMNFLLSYSWFKKSAESGYTPAQVSLGYIYDQGMGTEQNKIKAFMWWKIASMHGDSDAMTLLKLLSNEINENDQKIAINLADTCVKNNFKAC